LGQSQWAENRDYWVKLSCHWPLELLITWLIGSCNNQPGLSDAFLFINQTLTFPINIFHSLFFLIQQSPNCDLRVFLIFSGIYPTLPIAFWGKTKTGPLSHRLNYFSGKCCSPEVNTICLGGKVTHVCKKSTNAINILLNVCFHVAISEVKKCEKQK